MQAKNTKSGGFKNLVLSIVKNIPPGETLSYQAVAKLAGNQKAARAVASIMSKNYDPSVPCHRVIHTSGKVGEYNRGGTSEKLRLLIAEGWTQDNNN